MSHRDLQARRELIRKRMEDHGRSRLRHRRSNHSPRLVGATRTRNGRWWRPRRHCDLAAERRPGSSGAAGTLEGASPGARLRLFPQDFS